MVCFRFTTLRRIRIEFAARAKIRGNVRPPMKSLKKLVLGGVTLAGLAMAAPHRSGSIVKNRPDIRTPARRERLEHAELRRNSSAPH